MTTEQQEVASGGIDKLVELLSADHEGRQVYVNPANVASITPCARPFGATTIIRQLGGGPLHVKGEPPLDVFQYLKAQALKIASRPD